jgi:predicted nuclease with TOPRIM domain
MPIEAMDLLHIAAEAIREGVDLRRELAIFREALQVGLGETNQLLNRLDRQCEQIARLRDENRALREELQRYVRSQMRGVAA